MIEINWKTGADRFILSGSAGALDKEATAGKYVIPTAAYRDEGMSYHYAPPSDYISIPKADHLAEFFSKNHLPFVKGKVWTTDALYHRLHINWISQCSQVPDKGLSIKTTYTNP